MWVDPVTRTQGPSSPASSDLATQGAPGSIGGVETTRRHNPFRICALCRHFRVLESKREFPHIVDTAYLTYECAVLQQTKREDYLMDSSPQTSYVPHPEADFECPYWEEPVRE